MGIFFPGIIEQIDPMSLELGGLGVFSLKELGWALRVRWLWVAKTDPSRPWANLPLQISNKVKAMFHTAVISDLGSGISIKFWRDKWIHGQCIGEFAPRLLAAVPKRIANIRTVRDALTDRRWISDIRGSLTVGVIADFLSLWDALANMELQMDSEDKHIFRFASDGEYLANAAYDSMFIGSTQFAFFSFFLKQAGRSSALYIDKKRNALRQKSQYTSDVKHNRYSLSIR